MWQKIKAEIMSIVVMIKFIAKLNKDISKCMYMDFEISHFNLVFV